MNVLLDTNVVLDVLLDRAPWSTDSSAIWQACDDGRIVRYLPASTLTDIYYIARRASDSARARLAVGLCLATFALCSVDRRTVEQAAELNGRDFEDDVVAACALLSGIDVIVSRNSTDFSSASVPVLTPAALLAQLAIP